MNTTVAANSVLFSLLSIVTPLKNSFMGKTVSFDNLTALKESLSSIIQWVASNGAEEVL